MELLKGASSCRLILPIDGLSCCKMVGIISDQNCCSYYIQFIIYPEFVVGDYSDDSAFVNHLLAHEEQCQGFERVFSAKVKSSFIQLYSEIILKDSILC